MIQKYIKKEPIDHILSRPEMYVGSNALEEKLVYVYEKDKLVKKYININPALIRTFIEILSNAVDNIVRNDNSNDNSNGNPMTYIKINLSNTECEIINNGSSIPATTTDINGEKIYNQTLIFGHLYSSSNYNDEETRYTSGKNGLGAKLTNILSNYFEIETVENNLKFNQSWENNMKKENKYKITKYQHSSYTRIKWEWDLKWFNMKKISNDLFNYMKMMVFNTSIITDKKIKVYFNNVLFDVKIKDYFSYFHEDYDNKKTLYIKSDNNIILLARNKNSEFEQFSFVNGIQTKNGGTHVQAAIESIFKPIIEKFKTKITLRDIKKFFSILVITNIPNPVFESQEKNELKSKIKISPIDKNNINKILKWIDIKECINNIANKKELLEINKLISKKKKYNIDGYDKANYLDKNKNCVLIICEGLSAKSFAVEGISKGISFRDNVLKGRDWYGIYPLRGKLLNTRNSNIKSIKNNKILLDLITILGLDINKKNIKSLKYSTICILTDADDDGIHIECLLLNFFNNFFPDLLTNNHVISMRTPLYKINNKYFYSMIKDINKKRLNSTIKYNKGLGTISKNEVSNIWGKKIFRYYNDNNNNNELDKLFDVVFSKNYTETRKKLIQEYDNDKDFIFDRNIDNSFIDYPISLMLNQNLIKYFKNDCKRSIPNGVDGLKESQRKIIYAIKQKNPKEIKVAQLGAYVSEKTNYHHGEDNISKTIIKMAQNFIGSNNLPLLKDEGMFGTRLEGGDDSASPRYVFVKKSNTFDYIFNIEDDDLYEYILEEGYYIEPYFYVPIIPLLLINGSTGIGTGWMCDCPLFNINDVIKCCILYMEKKKSFYYYSNSIIPYYNNFKGKIIPDQNNTFITSGIYKTNKNNMIITELPIGLWNSKFQTFLDKLNIQYINKSTTSEVYYELLDINESLSTKIISKLSTSININNIVVFDNNNIIKNVNIAEVIQIWGDERIKLYTIRRNKIIKELESKILLNNFKIKFIKMILSKEIEVTFKENIIIDKIKSNISKDNDKINILLNMKVNQLTYEKRKMLENEIDELTKKLNIIISKTEKEMWYDDLYKFITKLNA